MTTGASPARSRGRVPFVLSSGLIAAALVGAAVGFSRGPAAAPAATVVLGDEKGAARHVPSSGNVQGEGSCSACHQFDAGFSHPIGVRPAAAPVGLPLSAGFVTCATCHDASSHGSGDPVGTRISGRALCLSCHGSGTDRVSMHAQSFGKAHLMLSAFRVRESAPSDNETESCMSCHDGTTGVDAGSHATGAGVEGGDHPVGVTMRRGFRSRDGDFHFSNTVDRRVRLFSGAVGCGSCHSLYSAEPAKLVMSNRGSALCMTCHTQR